MIGDNKVTCVLVSLELFMVYGYFFASGEFQIFKIYVCRQFREKISKNRWQTVPAAEVERILVTYGKHDIRSPST